MSALEKFGLPDTATPGEVKAKWRSLAAVHHPDKGGNAAEFARLRTLYSAALAESLEPKQCPLCHGSGKIIQTRGFNSIQLPCNECSGGQQ